jgi:hypothetical protein
MLLQIRKRIPRGLFARRRSLFARCKLQFPFAAMSGARGDDDALMVSRDIGGARLTDRAVASPEGPRAPAKFTAALILPIIEKSDTNQEHQLVR